MRPINLVDFYTGKSFRHDRIMNYNYQKLEDHHDYIQWLFPLKEKSRCVPKSPVLTDEQLVVLRSSEIFHKKYKESFELMLRFYGFRLTSSNEIVRYEFDKRSEHWLNRNNHDYLRLTRILKSLVLFGYEDWAIKLFEQLEKVYNEFNFRIGQTTFSYWKDAVNRGSEQYAS